MVFQQVRRCRTILTVFLSLTVLIVGNLEAGDRNHLRIGWASRKITPEFPVRMAGYGSKEREQPFHGIASDLYAKALVIQDEREQKSLLITLDVIGLSKSVSEPIYKRITEATGIKRKSILINSSHTHTGPVIGLDPGSLSYLKNESHIESTVRYTNKLVDAIVEIATEANRELQPARLSWGIGVATFVMNRREFTERGVRLGVNPRGLVDRSIPVLKFDSPKGKILCVVFGVACHNTTFGSKDMKISGDFAGYAQQKLEQELDGAQAMFVQGCGGDANPFPQGGEEPARIHGLTLASEVLRVLDSDLTPIKGTIQTERDTVELPLKQSLSKSDYEKLEKASGSTKRVGEELKKKIADGETLEASYQTEISLWQFGDDLTLVALPGEVVVDYVSLIEQTIGPRKLWVNAYNHDVFGYLASKRVIKEGGYEMRGIYSGGVGLFAPEVEDVVAKTVSELASKAGRETE